MGLVSRLIIIECIAICYWNWFADVARRCILEIYNNIFRDYLLMYGMIQAGQDY